MSTTPEQTPIQDIKTLKTEIKQLLKNSYYSEALSLLNDS